MTSSKTSSRRIAGRIVFLRDNQLSPAKNRFIKAGAFESTTLGGILSLQFKDFHSALAGGGIAVTALGYCAVAVFTALNFQANNLFNLTTKKIKYKNSERNNR
ncbi:MAG: hypothetical protein ACJAU3_000260 [Zhongshania sp.]|jgi:hypothetical protein